MSVPTSLTALIHGLRCGSASRAVLRGLRRSPRPSRWSSSRPCRRQLSSRPTTRNTIRSRVCSTSDRCTSRRRLVISTHGHTRQSSHRSNRQCQRLRLALRHRNTLVFLVCGEWSNRRRTRCARCRFTRSTHSRQCTRLRRTLQASRRGMLSAAAASSAPEANCSSRRLTTASKSPDSDL